MFRKSISVFLLALFIAYSGGICFSLHKCEHCQDVDISFFGQSDCLCCATVTEPRADETETEDQQEEPSCCHHEDASVYCPPDKHVYIPDGKQCCFSDFVYFKIHSDCLLYHYHKLIHGDDSPCIWSDLLWEEKMLTLLATSVNRTPPNLIHPLSAGGERFIVYAHQLLFYA